MAKIEHDGWRLLVKVRRARHSSTIEQPEAMTEAVEQFLEKVSPA